MAVDGAEIRSLAELGMSLHRNHGVDSDDGSTVAGCLQGGSCRSDGCGDLGRRRSSTVDEFVAYTDGVYDSPVVVDCRGYGLYFAVDIVDFEYSQKELDIALRGRDDVGYLVAIGTVETDDLVAGGLL